MMKNDVTTSNKILNKYLSNNNKNTWVIIDNLWINSPI